MTDIEEKSIKAQLQLSKDINSDNNMILYHVQTESKELITSIIQHHNAYGKENITLSVDEYLKLSKFLDRVSSNDGMKGLCNGFCKNYIENKASNEKILNIL